MKLILVGLGIVLAVLAAVLAPGTTTLLLAGAVVLVGISTVAP